MDRFRLVVKNCSETLEPVKERLSKCGIAYSLLENFWESPWRGCPKSMRNAVCVIETKNRKDSLHIRKLLGCERSTGFGTGSIWVVHSPTQIPKLSKMEMSPGFFDRAVPDLGYVASASSNDIFSAVADHSLSEQWD